MTSHSKITHMKSIVKSYGLLLLLTLFVSGIVRASGDEQEPKYEKKKSYTKSYPVSASDKAKFDNRFGDLKINIWDKNEIKVEINMSAKANSEEVAQELLDRISIEDGKSGSEVYVTTKIGDQNQKWPKGEKYNNTRFFIDFVVYMPARLTLTAKNEFGKTTIPDYAGELTLSQKFGSLTAGKLSNVKKVSVEFSGGSSIESISNGQLDIHFSRTQVNRLEGNVQVSVEHSGGVKLGIDNSLKNLNIKNSFTQLYLDASNNLSASFDIRTSFSEVDNKSSFSIKEDGEDNDRRGPKFDHDYSGKAGSGNIPIKIKSEFGEVTIGHNLKFDVTEKEEKKRSKNTRAV